MKDGKAVIVREQDDEALAVLEARCQVGATMSLEFRDWEVTERLLAVGGQSFAVRGLRASYEELFLPLFGEHAVRNAAAIAACEALLGEALDDATLREALTGVRWRTSRGRRTASGDRARRRPQPAGAEALAAALREFFLWDRLHLVLSIGASKDVGGIATTLADRRRRLRGAQRNEHGRAIPIAEAFGAEGKRVTVHVSVAEALDAARGGSGGRPHLRDWSLYTVADARRALGLTT